MLWTVPCSGEGDANALWVAVTSYGLTPSADLRSYWQSVRGVGR